MTLLELLIQLRDRYQIHTSEHKKPNVFEEIAIILEVSNDFFKGWPDEKSDLFLDWDILMDQILPTVEFLQHKDCFHPDATLWYYCPMTTAAEMVVLLNECIAITKGEKPCPNNIVKSVCSIIEE